MLGIVLALALVVVLCTTVAALIRSLTCDDRAIYRAVRAAWILRVSRQESADLDAQYEALLRG